MKRLKRGFTMIELLIVIAVLGVLAVAVLSAINPIEQINRGRDTGTRSDAEQLLSAIDRYYTASEMYPWQTVINVNEAVPLTEIGSLTDDALPTAQSVLNKLSEGQTAEIKASFANRLTGAANPISLYYSGVDGESVYACFDPQSGSFGAEAQRRCVDEDGGGLPTDLQAIGATLCVPGDEWVCLP